MLLDKIGRTGNTPKNLRLQRRFEMYLSNIQLFEADFNPEDIIFCEMCECEHENNTQCQRPETE